MAKDAIVTLGGGVRTDGSLPNIACYRVETAVGLFHQRVAPYLIMSGSHYHRWTDRPPITEASAMQEHACALDVPRGYILREEESSHTIGNACYTKNNILEPNQWKNIAVVTSKFHMPRTEYIFQKVLGSEYQIDFVEAPSHLLAREFEVRIKKELEKLEDLRPMLDSIPDGNDDAILSLLQEYTRNPETA